MVSTWRYLGCAVGFGFGVVWMTEGVGAAILTLLCAALGYAVVFVAEHERASVRRLRTPARTLEEDEPSLLLDELELTGDETEPVLAEAQYGWPSG